MSGLCLGLSAWCLEWIWGLRRSQESWYCYILSQDVAIPNPLATFEIGHTRIWPLLPVPSVFKRICLVVSGWCLWVSGLCLDGVWGCLGRHQYQIKNIYVFGHDAQILPFLPVHSNAKTSMSGGLDGSGWCLRVSGRCLDGVWECLGRHQYQICWQKYILGHDTQILHFLPVPCIAQKCICFGVSELCLGVSGLGLMVSGYVLIPNLLVKMYKT